MNITRLVLCGALAFSISACGKKDPVEKMVSMMEDMADAVDSAKGDCGKMADGVQKVADKYKGDIDEMKKAGEAAKKDKDEQKKLMDKYGDRLGKAMPKLMDMMQCASDPKMKAVEASMKGLM
jgi:DNA-binding ferritin-like protein